jgi:hypothetical protein
MAYPSSNLSALAYRQPWELADMLISLHLQYCSTFALSADPDPIIDQQKIAARLRNTLTMETGKILDYLYDQCGRARLHRIISELVNRRAYGVLREKKWLWEEAVECSPECREYANKCYRESYACTVAELPSFV